MGHLAGEGSKVVGSGRFGGVFVNGLPVTWGLGQPHIYPNEGLENKVAKMGMKLIKNFAGKVALLLKHRNQNSKKVQAWIEPSLDSLHNI
jgi:hypothetical protein